MKAVRIHNYGDATVLSLDEIAVPEIATDELLVRVISSAINPLDWILRSGHLKGLIPVEFPITLGWDFSGIVEKTGSDVRGYSVGDAVYSRPEVSRNGSHAEYIAVPARDVAHKPDTISHTQAASLPIASITAWQSLFEIGKLIAGQRVLIHAGAGSLGVIAIQMAKVKGAYVIATARQNNHNFLTSLGADELVDYSKISFQDAVSGVDVVLDSIGGAVQNASYGVLRKGGILVAVNTVPNFDLASEVGVVARFLSIKPNGRHLGDVATMVDEGLIRPVVGYEYALDDIKAAYQLSESRRARGKIILQVARP